jgi:protein TonB
MRTWTLGVSIVVHLCVIAGVIVSPLLATDDLPEPPRATEFLLVTAKVPAPPPEPRPVTPAAVTSAAPVEAPDTVTPEPPAPIVTPPGPIDLGVPTADLSDWGVVPGSVVAGDPLPPPPPPPPAPRPAVRVGGDIRPPQRIHHVVPRYPTFARDARVQGLVILEATISEDGSVRDVHVLRGNPLLDNAAVDAVRQWRFTPTRLNGQAVPVVMTVTVSFSLN